jgi:peptide deformylase
MLMLKDILKENNKKLRKASNEVILPLTDKDKTNIEDMIEYLTNSQIEEKALEYDLRPGMGLAAIQLGVNKRYFVIVHEQEDNTFNNYIVINPKVMSYSTELIYASGGEGCLSVERSIEGIIPRHARITIEYLDLEGNKQILRAREELAIAVQHEVDHLDGILFVDRIDRQNPFKNQEKMRMI